MSHGSGLYVPPYVLRGARQVVPASGAFEPDEFLDLCDHHPGAVRFSRRPWCSAWCRPDVPRPRDLKTVVYGGGPMYVDSLKKAMAAFGPIFVQLYGQGEAPMTITGLRRADHLDADDAVLGSVGYARSGVDVAVLAADGSPAAIDEIGEIVCRGDVVMSGYWKNADATAVHSAGRVATHRRYGVLRCQRVPDAARSLQGRGDQRRKQHLPARGGRGADRAPRGFERRASSGRPTTEWGEVVVAFIVGSASAAELDAYLLERIARFKRPKRYEFIDEIPKNSYGKVLKRELRAQLA